MAMATDRQMQDFFDLRIRVRAEAFRDVQLGVNDDLANIGDIYARAISSTQFADGRLDGPPHLAAAGDAANPNDVTEYNAFATLFQKFLAGTFTSLAEANSAPAKYGTFQRMCA